MKVSAADGVVYLRSQVRMGLCKLQLVTLSVFVWMNWGCVCPKHYILRLKNVAYVNVLGRLVQAADSAECVIPMAFCCSCCQLQILLQIWTDLDSTLIPTLDPQPEGHKGGMEGQ